jgi:hypothetical protein
MEATLAGLGNRVFLMNNVHEDAPVVMETRWCLSYLRGPLTRPQIQTLMADKKRQGGSETASQAPRASATVAQEGAAPVSRGATSGDRPLVPPEAQERFMPLRGNGGPGGPVVYCATLVGAARVHYVDAKAAVDVWQDLAIITRIDEQTADDPWASGAEQVEGFDTFETQPVAGATFGKMPSAALQAKNYRKWEKSLATHLYSRQPLKLWNAPELKEYSRPEEREAEFRVRLRQRQREERDKAVAALRQKYAKKHESLAAKIRRAAERVDREKSQLQGEATRTIVSVGTSILNAVLGRKAISQRTVTGAASAARGASRTANQRGDVARAQAALDALAEQQRQLDEQLHLEVSELEAAAGEAALVEYPIRPRKADVSVEKVSLVWVPTS